MDNHTIFVTGTDTGAGKTLLTSLGLSYLRNRDVNAIGIKPFCSGSRSDAQHLFFHNDQCIPMEEVNPWYGDLPISPGAMPAGQLIPKQTVTDYIKRMRSQGDVLLVEGAGGLLSPLGKQYHLGDLSRAFQPRILLAAPNRLGVLNQVLLNHAYLTEFISPQRIQIVLMGVSRPDLSAKSNARMLRRWLGETQVIEIPYLGRTAKSKANIQHCANRLSRTLKRLFVFD